MNKLIKFVSSKEYADFFLSGKLYMNALNYFWGNGFDEQKDIFEGVVCSMRANKSMLPIPMSAIQATDLRFRACGYKYCNVLCFYKLEMIMNGDLCTAQINNDMKKFGKYAIIIEKESEFIRRVTKAVNQLNYKFVCGDVHYHTPKKDGKTLSPGNAGNVIFASSDNTPIDLRRIHRNTVAHNFDSFDKSIEYSNQNEWRIALYRGEADTQAYVLEVGDLHDICKCVRFNELTDYLSENYKNPYQAFLIQGYGGNISRKELRELFYELGDFKATMFMAI